MKRLQKLTLKELGESVEVLDRSEAIGLRGGEGEEEYFARYGVVLPEGVSYDPLSNTCYVSGSFSSETDATDSQDESGSVGRIDAEEFTLILTGSLAAGNWGMKTPLIGQYVGLAAAGVTAGVLTWRAIAE